jgi:hypothetical protein
MNLPAWKRAGLHIAEAHGGTVGVASSGSQGNVFAASPPAQPLLWAQIGCAHIALLDVVGARLIPWPEHFH